MKHSVSPTFAALVQEFFGPYMLQQRALSPRTVASYRDTFVLLLRYADDSLGIPTHSFTLADLSASCSLAISSCSAATRSEAATSGLRRCGHS